MSGSLYTVASPTWAFGFLAAAMLASIVVLVATSEQRLPPIRA